MKKALLIIATSAMFLSIGCGGSRTEPLPDQNSLVKDFRPLSGFSEIRAGKAVELRVRVGEDFAVTVEKPENGSDDVTTELDGQILILSSKPVARGSGRPLIVDVSLPELNRLDIWGSTVALVENAKSESLTLQATGDSKITISGEVVNLRFLTTGVSLIDAENLRVRNAGGTSTGTSIVNLASPSELEAESHGASKITFAEQPKKLVPMIIGGGKIEKR